ncbi:MAG: hypothetical protein ACK55I_32955, partial [bacterium]
FDQGRLAPRLRGPFTQRDLPLLQQGRSLGDQQTGLGAGVGEGLDLHRLRWGCGRAARQPQARCEQQPTHRATRKRA